MQKQAHVGAKQQQQIHHDWWETTRGAMQQEKPNFGCEMKPCLEKEVLKKPDKKTTRHKTMNHQAPEWWEDKASATVFSQKKFNEKPEVQIIRVPDKISIF